MANEIVDPKTERQGISIKQTTATESKGFNYAAARLRFHAATEGDPRRTVLRHATFFPKVRPKSLRE